MLTKNVYKTQKILGCDMAIPTGQKIALTVLDDKFDYNKFYSDECSFLITYNNKYQYFLICPKENLPKDGFIRIRGARLYFDRMNRLNDERENDKDLYVCLTVNKSILNRLTDWGEDYWAGWVDHKSGINMWILNN